MKVKTQLKAGQAAGDNTVEQTNTSSVTVSQTNTSRIGAA
jgi:hypothetical protein